MPASAVHTPLLGSKSSKSGRGLYMKQLLPAGKTLTVNGQKLALTPQLFEQIKESFDSGFLDVTPFSLVDSANAHNDSPENVRGRVRDVEVQPDGLYGLIDAPDSLFEHNPDLPVSVRLKFDQERADGRKAPVVLAHVAGTNDPHVGGMKTWERVTDLSADPTPVVDLTAATYQGDTLMALSDEQLARLAAFADSLGDDGRPATAADMPADHGVTAEQADEFTADDEAALEAMLADLNDDEPQPADVAASASSPSVDLAATEQIRSELTEVQLELAAARWKQAAGDYVKAGVPPFLVDCAAQAFDPSTVDLSAGNEVDPFGVIREMLDLSKGLLDVNSERGTVVARTDDAEADARRQRAAAANAHFGVK